MAKELRNVDFLRLELIPEEDAFDGCTYEFVSKDN